MKKLNLGFKIVERKWIWFAISLSIIFIGAVFMLIFGLTGNGAVNLGVDFTGGNVLTVNTNTYLNNEQFDDVKKDIEDVLKDNGLTHSPVQSIDKGATVKYSNKKELSKDAMNELNTEIQEQIEAKLVTKYGEDFVKPFGLDTVSASASLELWLNALLCISIAAVLILIYVAFRFEFFSGISALIALIHDVLIMIAFVAIFRIQVNSPFIAGVITIIGYSINNTIVVFDRIRENKALYKQQNYSSKQIVSTAVKDTIMRSINTTITTLATILVLFIIGVPSIREFVGPIIIGLLAGTFSSIFIAPSLWSVFTDANTRRKKKKEKEYQAINNIQEEK